MPFYFEYTKAVTYTVENVGGGIGQDPAAEVTHLGFQFFPVFALALSPGPAQKWEKGLVTLAKNFRMCCVSSLRLE